MAQLIFAWNDNDPQDNDPNLDLYHGADQRGTHNAFLLGGLEQVPPDPVDIDSFTVAFNNVRRSGYSCRKLWL